MKGISLKKSKQGLTLLAFVFILTGCGSQQTTRSEDKEPRESAEYKLVWADEFDYTGLPDSTKWDYDTEGNDAGWGNNEAQYYTKGRPENAIVEDGVLKIIALKENFKNKKYTSARLMSKADWQYGRVEVNAKLPPGRGNWSAIWMMPGGWTFNDGNWPDIGEIDIMEHVAHETGVIHASAHSKDYQWQKNTQKTATVFIDDVTEKFHTYAMEWSPEVMKTYVDDSLYFEYRNEGLGVSKWPYDKPFYLIMNIAIGGAWGSMQGIEDESFPQVMEVDYVRIYQK
jgi:beta-glucanase (GH16 family)